MSDKKHSKDQGVGGTVMCKFKGCKHSPSKYSFCKEHFDQFKFGLINKNGEYVPDYEKKVDQFANWRKLA